MNTWIDATQEGSHKQGKLSCDDTHIVDVYIAPLPVDVPIREVECEERQREMDAISNERVKREKYFVWKLLCYALEHSFGLLGEEAKLQKEDFGGWSAGEISLSLSHSEEALAVAVSYDTVGVDIQLAHAPRAETIAERMLCERELLEYQNAPEEKREERFIELWTAKEALFKSQRKKVFLPKETDTTSSSIHTESTFIANKKYIWSLATPTPKHIRLFTNIDLASIEET